MEWISVNDRLPEREGNGFIPCLMWRSDFNEVRIGMFNNVVKRFQTENFIIQSMITHWMPLPKPPKK